MAPGNRRTTARLSRRRAVTENAVLADSELAKGKFSFIYSNSCQQEMPVKHCFPLFYARATCESAILSLVKEFGVDESGTVGYSAAGGLKIVVKIPEDQFDLVKEYLLSQGKNESEASSLTFGQGIEWFGIVDGRHIHNALLRLETLRPEPFLDFKWVVTVIEWQSLSTLKAFSRARNMLQSTNVVTMTLYDTISGICEIAQEKARLSGNSVEVFVKQRGAITKIADEFSGGSRYAKQTTRTLAGAALRIKPAALNVLGRIMNEEDHELARTMMQGQDCAEMLNADAVYDARAYKNIISTNTLRAATVFLNANAQDQANALIKLKYGFELNGFKCFQASRLNKEADRSARARHQIHLMNGLMGREKWPDELADIERKLQISSLFDDDLDRHDLSDDTIMPSLVAEYRERMPLEAGIRWRLYSRERQTHSSQNQNSGENGNQEQNRSTQQQQPQQAPEEDEYATESCPLERLNVNCLNMGLEKFVSHRERSEERFHLITGDPTQLQLNGTCKSPLEGHQADKYIAILKTMLQPHGWIFLYTRAVDFAMWDKAFRANGCEPLAFPWPMIRDTETIQANTSPIPQNITEWMIGARKKDIGSPTFQPDTNSTYKRSVSSRKRKFAIVDCCSEPTIRMRKPNTCEPLRSNQRSPEPMAEFLDTFCPKDGNVLDAFAGTLETARACFLTNRRCTTLEADHLCFDVAFEKLKESAAVFLSQTETDERTLSMDDVDNLGGICEPSVLEDRDVPIIGVGDNRNAYTLSDVSDAW